MRRTAALVLITLACFACGEDAELDPSEGQSNGYGPLTDAGEVEADVAPPLDSQMDWTIDSGELLGEYQGNLARECKLEKEGQYYLSATYFEDGNLTFGIRFRPTGETPEEIPIVGLNAGQDPEPGQGLAALSGSLMSPETDWEGVTGTLFLQSVEPCEGGFEVVFEMEDEESVSLEGTFLVESE